MHKAGVSLAGLRFLTQKLLVWQWS